MLKKLVVFVVLLSFCCTLGSFGTTVVLARGSSKVVIIEDFSSYDADNSAYGAENIVTGYRDHGETKLISQNAAGFKWVLSPYFAGTFNSSGQAPGGAYVNGATGVLTIRDKVKFCENVIEEGLFNCVDSENHGYVAISKNDSRYFAYTDGTTFCPVGINMVYPTLFEVSNGKEFGVTGECSTMGIAQYKRWFSQLAASGGNFARIWLGHEYFCIDGGNVNELRIEQFIKLDAIIEEARKYNIRLKITLEQFRFFGKKTDLFYKNVKTEDGIVCENGTEWLTEDKWQNAWFSKVQEIMKRYGNDPVIMCWELWNEMNCFDASSELVIKWNRDVLPKIKQLSPCNLITNSIGSWSRDMDKYYVDFKIPELDFQQAHVYLDQGCPSELCWHNPFEFTAHTVNVAKREGCPTLIAETGAVNDTFSGPFRYYHADHRGIIFADCVYTPFFAGAAGVGQIWYWDGRYVDAKNLYGMYRPFADMINRIEVDKEDFESAELSNDNVWCRVLIGNNHILGYIRNKEDSWYNVLRDLNEVNTVEQVEIPIADISGYNLELFPIWSDDTTEVETSNDKVVFKNLKYGILFKLSK